MYPLAKIPYAQIELSWDHVLAGAAGMRARQLRGAIATAFADDDLFHQHDPQTGKPLYRYPRIQYRWDQGKGIIIGWYEAAERLTECPWFDLQLQLGEDEVRVTDVGIRRTLGEFAVSSRLERYRLHTPLLLFNQENYERYQEMDEEAKRAERDRLLVSNLLIALRGLGILFPDRLYAAFARCHHRPCHYKGQDLLGLTGEILVNATLPDGFAFGHATSHGYGWISQRVGTDTDS